MQILAHGVEDPPVHTAVESGAEEDSDEEGDEAAEYGTKSAAKAAAFWEGLLRPHHERLVQAEQAAAAHALPAGRLANAPAASRRGQGPGCMLVGSGAHVMHTDQCIAQQQHGQLSNRVSHGRTLAACSLQWLPCCRACRQPSRQHGRG